MLPAAPDPATEHVVTHLTYRVRVSESGSGTSRRRWFGLLVLASCSSRITPAQFRETMTEAAARAGFELGVVEETGHAVDHPVGFTEGRYLKCLFCRPRRR